MVPKIPMVNLNDILLFQNITLTLHCKESLNCVNLPHLPLRREWTLEVTCFMRVDKLAAKRAVTGVRTHGDRVVLPPRVAEHFEVASVQVL